MPDGRSNARAHQPGTGSQASVFQLLGGELVAIDTWTRIDFSWMEPGTAEQRDVVGYRGLTMPYRVAGLTLGDADAAPACPPFLIEIWPDRVSAQVFWHRGDASESRIGACDAAVLQHWAAGSLSKDLRVVRFGDGDPGLEAELHLSPATAPDALREFVTAFSWDVAALHAYEHDGKLLTTEDWVRRAAVSISRSTPFIPLREHPTAGWPAHETPRGVFCSLQQSGGVCQSDNVLYVVRREAGSLVPLATMPGHRTEWGLTRLIDVWLARDGAACFARSLMCEGFLATADGVWKALDSDPVTAVASWGPSGFLLGLHDGIVLAIDAAQRVSQRHQLGQVSGRMVQLATIGDRAIGLCDTMLVSARLAGEATGPLHASAVWSTNLAADLSFDTVADLDIDQWSSVPVLAVAGDDGIGLVDTETGVLRAHFACELPRQARWVGPGWLLVMTTIEQPDGAMTELRVLDTISGRWTERALTGEVSRLAVRGNEIHVGYANQSVAVWDRLDVCRGIGATSFRTVTPDGIERGTGSASSPAPAPDHRTV